MILKNAFRGIGKNILGYISILLVVIIGISAFAGLNMAETSSTGALADYLDIAHYYDLKITSDLGFAATDLKYFQDNLKDVYYIEGAHAVEFLNGRTSSEKMIARSITSTVNKLTVVHGRMPSNDKECVVDAAFFDKNTIGTLVEPVGIAGNNSGIKSSALTVVGVVTSPFYLTEDNKVDIPCIYITEAAFSSTDYTELYIKLSTVAAPLSEEYNAVIKDASDKINSIKNTSAQNRYSAIHTERNEAILKAEADYNLDLNTYNAIYQAKDAEYANQLASYNSDLQLLNAEYDKLEAIKKECDEKIALAEAQYERVEEDISKNPAQISYLQQQLQAISAAILGHNTTKASALSSQATIVPMIDDIHSKITGLEIAKAATKVTQEAEKAKLDETAKGIEQAKTELATLKVPTITVSTRNDNKDISGFSANASSLGDVAVILSFVCCVIVVAVGSIVMLGIVGKGKEQIRIIKSLGYGSLSAIAEYLICSAIVGVVGCAIGFFVGAWLIPQIMWQINFSGYLFATSTPFTIDPIIAGVSAAVALICSIGSALISGLSVAGKNPAEITNRKTKKYVK